jgi:hypothetical protein
MRNALKNGTLELILPRLTGGGLTGEVHLLTYDNKKFILRRCKTIKRARKYEKISKKFEKHSFLPRLIQRCGRDVIYEFIEGRQLRANESLKVFEQIGKILAEINKEKSDEKINYGTLKRLEELSSGKFNLVGKVAQRRKRNGLNKNPGKALSSKKNK